MQQSTRFRRPAFRLGRHPSAEPASPFDEEHPKTDSQTASARVLIVDDNASVRRYVSETLRRVGHQVEAVHSGTAAIALWPSDSPYTFDLVILDARMPGLDGWETYERLHAAHPETKFLFMSGYPDHDVWQKVLAAKLPHVGKPCSPRDLREIVASLLR